VAAIGYEVVEEGAGPADGADPEPVDVESEAPVEPEAAEEPAEIVEAPSSEPAAAPPPEESAPEIPAVETPPRRRFALQAHGRALFCRSFVAGGGGLSFQHDLGRVLGWGVDVMADGGGSDTSLGQVDLLLLSAAAQVRAGYRFGWLHLEGALGARFAYTRLRGQPEEGSEAQGHELTGAWGGPLLQIAATARPGGRLVISLVLEGGYALFGLEGAVTNDSNISFDQLWGSVGLGVGVDL